MHGLKMKIKRKILRNISDGHKTVMCCQIQVTRSGQSCRMWYWIIHDGGVTTVTLLCTVRIARPKCALIYQQLLLCAFMSVGPPFVTQSVPEWHEQTAGQYLWNSVFLITARNKTEKRVISNIKSPPHVNLIWECRKQIEYGRHCAASQKVAASIPKGVVL